MGALVVHIGLPKTGSTAVQDGFASNAASLAAYGLRYSESVRGPNHVPLAVAFSSRTTALTSSVGVRSERDRRRLRERIHKRLTREAAGNVTTFLSSEHLASHLRSPAEIADLAEFLQGISDRVTVIAFLRRADYWLPSAYAEAVFGGIRMPLRRKFVRRRAHLLDHRGLLDSWTSSFGQANVQLLPFLEADKRDPAVVTVRLLDQFGVPGEQIRNWPVPPAVARTGLSAAATEALRRLTPRLPSSGLRYGRDRARLREALALRLPGPPVALTPAAKRELTRRGWIRNGIDTSPQAVGSDWAAWRDQPDAPVGPMPTLADDDVEALLADLRRDGIVRRSGAWGLTDHARRLGLALRR